MRRSMWIGALLLVIVALLAVGVGAYNWGLTEGLERADSGVEVVRVVGGHGGFPFGLILFPLFFIGIFALMKGAFWARAGRWGDHDHGGGDHGPWASRFEDWHRRQHEEGPGPSTA